VASLLAAAALLALGHGLLGSVLALRALGAGEDAGANGFFKSAHFVGLLLGAATCQSMIFRVGRIRMFAAFASLISAISVAHLLIEGVVAWAALRLAHGYAYAVIVVVVESWLNGHAVAQTRGRLLAIYGIVSMSALGAGQLLLNVAPPSEFSLLVLSSILISLSLLPVALAGPQREPAILAAGRLSLWRVWRKFPLEAAGALILGMVFSSLLALGPVYARDMDFSRGEIAIFMAAPLLASVVIQFPLGWLSDRMDRRYIILFSSLVAAMAAAMLTTEGSFWQRCALSLLLGGFFIPLYSLCLARANDKIGEQSLLATAGAIMMLYSLGSAPAPLVVGFFMRTHTPSALFASLAVLLLGLATIVIWQLIRHPYSPTRAEPFQVTPTPSSSTSPLLRTDPRSQRNAIANDNKKS
jgi:MFS family permease